MYTMKKLLPIMLATVILFPVAARESTNTGSVNFSPPETVITGPASEIRLAISPDGNHQLFGIVRHEDEGGLDIVERYRDGDDWSEPADVPFNTQWNDFDPAFTPDGSGIYFFSNRPGGKGGDDIWFVPLQDGDWGNPINIGAPINTPGDEWAPTPLADGHLLFSSDGHGGFGGQDLYIAEHHSDSWQEPENLGEPVNSAQHDYDAVFLDDDLSAAGPLVFTRSNNPGEGSKLVYSCQPEGGFTSPRPAGRELNLGGGWALGPSVSASHPGVLFFSGRSRTDKSIQVYRTDYEVNCH